MVGGVGGVIDSDARLRQCPVYGLLAANVETGVRYGVAISAIKQTLPGDIVYATKEEVDRTLEGGGLRIVR